VFIGRWWLVEGGRFLGVEGVDLEAGLHCLSALLGEDPGVRAASVEDGTNFLRSTRTNVQLADV